ncbi:MAG: nuclear transport factor 2 family protein [Gemmatimonadales bacterium]
MTTRDTIHGYFESLKQKGAWSDFLADEMQFTSFTASVKRAAGKAAYLEATKGFYSLISAVHIEGMVVEGERACVLTRYDLQPPGGATFESHVAEVFEVRNGKIEAFNIYFDSAAFPK